MRVRCQEVADLSWECGAVLRRDLVDAVEDVRAGEVGVVEHRGWGVAQEHVAQVARVALE